MVHISLPHRHKDKGRPAAGDLQPDELRSSPSRSPSQNTVTNGGEKPLILKIYVIRVGSAIKHLAAMCIDRFYRLETLRQRTDLGPAIR
jgi:hypothetical protein